MWWLWPWLCDPLRRLCCRRGQWGCCHRHGPSRLLFDKFSTVILEGAHTMPVGDVLIRDSGCHVEHNDTALTYNTCISAGKEQEKMHLGYNIRPSNLRISPGRRYPRCWNRLDQSWCGMWWGALVRHQRYPSKPRGQVSTFNTESSNIFLLKLPRKMSLHKCSLSRKPILANFWATLFLKTRVSWLDITFPVPPSPTRTSLNVGISCWAAIPVVMFACATRQLMVLTSVFGGKNWNHLKHGSWIADPRKARRQFLHLEWRLKVLIPFSS